MLDPTLIQKAEHVLALGRAYLRKSAPYISTTLYGLIFYPLPSIHTMGVTPGMVLYYDPEWVLGEPSFKDKDGVAKEVVAACLYHECWHLLRDIKRIEALPDRQIANIAADLAINSDLRKAGWTLPPWVAYPETFKLVEGLTMEQYYALLQKKSKVVQAFLSLGLGLGGGDSSNKEGDDQPGAGKDGKDKAGKGKGKSKGAGSDEPTSFGDARPGPCSGSCGGIAGHSSIDESSLGIEKKLDGKVGRDAADRERIRHTTAHEIQKHLQQFGRGSAPGFYEEDLPFTKQRSRVDWKKEVDRVVRRVTGRVIAGGNDYSIRRPAKRSALLGVVRPGLIDQICEIAFIRDTSASMGQEQLNSANNEILAAINRTGVDEIWLLDADAQVQGKPMRVRAKQVPRIKPKGRGGTCFIDALEAVQKLHPRVDAIVYLTDSDGTAPEYPPRRIPVIWVIIDRPRGSRPYTTSGQPISWGHFIYVDEAE